MREPGFYWVKPTARMVSGEQFRCPSFPMPTEWTVAQWIFAGTGGYWRWGLMTLSEDLLEVVDEERVERNAP